MPGVRCCSSSSRRNSSRAGSRPAQPPPPPAADAAGCGAGSRAPEAAARRRSPHGGADGPQWPPPQVSKQRYACPRAGRRTGQRGAVGAGRPGAAESPWGLGAPKPLPGGTLRVRKGRAVLGGSAPTPPLGSGAPQPPAPAAGGWGAPVGRKTASSWAVLGRPGGKPPSPPDVRGEKARPPAGSVALPLVARAWPPVPRGWRAAGLGPGRPQGRPGSASAPRRLERVVQGLALLLAGRQALFQLVQRVGRGAVRPLPPQPAARQRQQARHQRPRAAFPSSPGVPSPRVVRHVSTSARQASACRRRS